MMNYPARFWAKVGIGKEDACWLWTGKPNDKGYGSCDWQHSLGEKRAHRMAWMFWHGMQIPGGMFVCHHCDVPLCCNPHHLFLGTSADNTADMVAKGRHVPPRGERNNHARLTNAQVIFIRSQQGRTSDLARQFGVSFSTMRYARLGLSWRHV